MSSKVVYRLSTEKDHESIKKFLREHFLPDEPLTIACGSEEIIIGETYYMSCIAEKDTICLIALINDQIVGVGIMKPKGPEREKHLLEEIKRFPGTKWARICLLLAALEKESNVCEKYNVNKVMHGEALAVHKEYRNNKIGLEIYLKLMGIAKKMGYTLFTSNCTNKFSARISEGFGMDCVSVRHLDDFLFTQNKQKIVKSYVKSML